MALTHLQALFGMTLNVRWLRMLAFHSPEIMRKSQTVSAENSRPQVRTNVAYSNLLKLDFVIFGMLLKTLCALQTLKNFVWDVTMTMEWRRRKQSRIWAKNPNASARNRIQSPIPHSLREGDSPSSLNLKQGKHLLKSLETSLGGGSWVHLERVSSLFAGAEPRWAGSTVRELRIDMRLIVGPCWQV